MNLAGGSIDGEKKVMGNWTCTQEERFGSTGSGMLDGKLFFGILKSFFFSSRKKTLKNKIKIEIKIKKKSKKTKKTKKKKPAENPAPSSVKVEKKKWFGNLTEPVSIPVRVAGALFSSTIAGIATCHESDVNTAAILIGMAGSSGFFLPKLIPVYAGLVACSYGYAHLIRETFGPKIAPYFGRFQSSFPPTTPSTNNQP